VNTERPTVVIEVYADIGCPFAHVGVRTLRKHCDDLGRHDVALHVRAWPLELVNSVPLDPQTTTAHVEELRSQVAPDLFSGFVPANLPRTTLPALALAASAYRDDIALGEAVGFALRDALFERGRDVSRHDVLAEIARTYQLTVTPQDELVVIAEWHEGRARGVRGSPHFFCGGISAFCPSLEIARDSDGQLHLRRDVEAIGRFVSQCCSEQENEPRWRRPA
jgi:predicted DsbA family dithiol-disulfide isomerase